MTICLQQALCVFTLTTVKAQVRSGNICLIRTGVLFGAVLLWWGMAATTEAGVANSWTNSVSGLWRTAGNWSVGIPKLQQGVVLITNAIAKTVTIDSLTSTNSLTISNLTVHGNGSVVNTLSLINTNLSSPLRVLSYCTINTGGQLVISNSCLDVGGMNFSSGPDWISSSPALQISGSVILSGGQLLATNRVSAFPNVVILGEGGALHIGAGTLLADGLSLGSSNAMSTLRFTNGLMRASNLAVGGNHSTNFIGGWVIAIHSSRATVWMDGGTLTLTNEPSSSLLIDGKPGTALDDTQMTISNGTVLAESLAVNHGVLHLAGGIVQLVQPTNAFVIGKESTEGTATGVVWVTGGQLSIPGTLSVGDSAAGRMTITSGVVQAANLYIASHANVVTGSLDIAGGITTVTNGILMGDCPSGGAGNLTIRNGLLTVTNADHTAVLEVRHGTLTVAGGTLIADKLILTNPCADFVHSGGIVNVRTLIFDTDNDGLPNDWELAHGMNPFANDAQTDTDGDGFTALQEYVAGTDPFKAQSALRISNVGTSGTDMLISFSTVTGKCYLVQRCDDLANPSGWTTVQDNVPGTGGLVQVADPGAAVLSRRFYRVRLLSP